MFQTYGLSHLQINVNDLERSVQFYKDLFGMKEVRRFDHCVMVQTPGTHEIFTINADPSEERDVGKMGGIAHFGFRLRDLVEMDRVFEEATRLGGRPLTQWVEARIKGQSLRVRSGSRWLSGSRSLFGKRSRVCNYLLDNRGAGLVLAIFQQDRHSAQ